MDKTAADGGCEPKPGNVANLVRRISSELKSKCAAGTDPSARRSFADFRSRRLKVVAAHVPISDEELRLEINDVVEFIGEDDEGRLRGRLNGKVGTFPSSCVKFIDPLAASRLVIGGDSGGGGGGSSVDGGGFLSSTTTTNTTTTISAMEPRRNGAERAENSSIITATATTSVIQPKKVMGVGFGNIFAANDGRIGLRSARLVADERKTADDVVVTKPSPTAIKKQEWLASSITAAPVKEEEKNYAEVRKELVRANYAYNAENDDELSFKAGDIITVLSKESEDAGWWLGELNGRRGVFPDNFIAPYVAVEDAAYQKSQPPIVPMKPTKPCSTVVPPSSSSSTIDMSTSVGNKLSMMSPTLLAHHGPKVVAAASGTTTAAASLLEASERKSDNVASAADDHHNDTTTTTSVAEKLDKLGAFRFPMFLKSKSAVAPKPVDSTDDAKLDHHQEKAKAELVEQQHEPPADGGAEKLSHLTAARPKMKKRPPSRAFLKGMADGSQNGLVKSTLTALSEIDGELTADAMPSSTAELIPEEFEALRQAFAEFKSKVLSDIKELEKRFATVEALILNKRPPPSHCSSSSG